jgi:putative transposase
MHIHWRLPGQLPGSSSGEGNNVYRASSAGLKKFRGRGGVGWQCDGVLDRIHYALYVACREKAEREATPTAAIIDSQSVKSAEKGGARIDPHGYDAGKKIKGKKRHILVDTLGLLLHAMVHSAGIQDRDGGISLLATMKGLFPLLEKLFADSAYHTISTSG